MGSNPAVDPGVDLRHVRISQEDLFLEAKLRFGGEPLDFAFVCPHCGDVATLREWKAIDTTDRAGQDCIGRADPATVRDAGVSRKGCNWASYGLFRGPWEVIAADRGEERSIWGFPLVGDPAPGGPVARFLEGRD